MTRWSVFVTLCVLLTAKLIVAEDASSPTAQWPQFRGPQGSGVATDGKKLPVQFGPTRGVLWKTALPPGHSSPCVWGNRIFLTGYVETEKKLETFCLARDNGKILWQQAAPATKIEKVHQISNPATSTPATDGERVYVYFGSYGVLCYDFDGTEQWKMPLPVPATRFGSGTSPILAGELLLLNCEYSPLPGLIAINRKTGAVAWKKTRFGTSEGYATPVLWRRDGADVVVIHRPGMLTAHNLADGSERWWVGVNSVACSTPVVGGDRLFAATWQHGGEPDDRVTLPSFEELRKQYDKDENGLISKQEFPADLTGLRRAEAGDIPGAEVKLITFFSFLDTNKDGQVSREEWALVLAFGTQQVEHGLLAINPDGNGDVTKTHVAWKEQHAIPEVPSPLFLENRIFMVRDGGILSSLDAPTGKLVYRERVGTGGAYFASPVAGGNKLYVASRNGVVSVIAAGDTFTVLAKNDFEEPILATPALVDGKIYLRTESQLYAFGE